MLESLGKQTSESEVKRNNVLEFPQVEEISANGSEIIIKGYICLTYDSLISCYILTTTNRSLNLIVLFEYYSNLRMVDCSV